MLGSVCGHDFEAYGEPQIFGELVEKRRKNLGQAELTQLYNRSLGEIASVLSGYWKNTWYI